MKSLNVCCMVFLLGMALNLYAQNFDGWRVMPVRSREEFAQGKTGGEGEQHLHGIARCLNHPERIYLSHDVAQIWRSDDAGETWIKCPGAGMHAIAGQSIEVDPVNPDIVFAIMDNTYDYLAVNYRGLYRSLDGGITWTLVLPTATNFNSSRHRIYTHNIAYDSTSVDAASGKILRWYAAFPDNGLFRSDDGGSTWNQVSILPGHQIVYTVRVHPQDGNTVYMGTEDGLYVSRSGGDNLEILGDLNIGAVTSIEVHPYNPDIIYVVRRAAGLYKSENGGELFAFIRNFSASRVFMNPGYPDILYLIGFNANTLISADGGLTWDETKVHPAPGLGREYKTSISGELAGIVPNPKNPAEAVGYSTACIWKTTDTGANFYDSSTLFTGFAWGWWNKSVAFDRFNPLRFATFNFDVSMNITENGGDYFERRRIPWDWYQNGILSWVGQYSGDFQPVPNSNVIVASAGNYWETKIVRSENRGEVWQVADTRVEHHLLVTFHSTDPNVVYAGNKISRDGGRTFQDVSFLNNYAASIVGMCEGAPDVIYAMSRDPNRNKIFRSDDRGVTWRIYVQAGWNFNRLDSKPTFCVHPMNPDVIYTLGSTGDLASYDGKEWKNLNVLSLAGGTQFGNFVRGIAIDPNFPNVMYARMNAAGIDHVWRSIDRGETWRNATFNLPKVGGSGIVVNPHTGELFIGSAFGTWILPPPYKSSELVYDRQVTRPYFRDMPVIYTGPVLDANDNPPVNNVMVRIYDTADNRVIGEGITRNGEYRIQVDTDDPDTQVKEGAADNGSIYAKILIDRVEYPLYSDSTKLNTLLQHRAGEELRNTLWTKDVTLEVNGANQPPQNYSLGGNFPNPFNPSTNIRYVLPRMGRVELAIYDITGKEIVTLLNEIKNAGEYEVRWNGIDASGRRIASGIYFYRMQAGEFIQTKKMLFIK